jgi:hypothetical protein
MSNKTVVTFFAAGLAIAAQAGNARAAVEPSCPAELRMRGYPIECVKTGGRMSLRLTGREPAKDASQDTGVENSGKRDRHVKDSGAI